MQDYSNWIGKDAYDPGHNKIGTIEDLYVDENDGQPTWMTIKSGLFGTKHNFAPVQGAHEIEDHIMLSVTEHQVKSAPGVDPDGELSDDEHDSLYQHYNMRAGSGTMADTDMDDDDHVDTDNGNDVSGPNTDDAMTRSEEEVEVGTRREQTGRVRLRKYVVHDTVTKTVPIEREEVCVEREPIDPSNVDQATNGPDISEEDHEVTLSEDVPVVEKKAVPKERVRLEKDMVRDEKQITEDVRKEEIDVDDERR